MEKRWPRHWNLAEASVVLSVTFDSPLRHRAARSVALTP
jgi:hypothetical protein